MVDIASILNIAENLTDDAKNVVSFLASSALASSKMDLPATLESILTKVTTPKQASSSGQETSAQKVLYTLDDILDVAAMVPEPEQPIVASAATVLGIIAADEPEILAGGAALAAGAAALIASGKLGEIPDVTKMTESEIADRFQTVFKMTPRKS